MKIALKAQYTKIDKDEIENLDNSMLIKWIKLQQRKLHLKWLHW